MSRATITLSLLAVAVLWACGGKSADFWKEAEPNGAVRVEVARVPPGTSGKGGATAVAYATDVALDETIDTYVEFFRTRGVAPRSREALSAYFRDQESGLCMTIEPWGQGVGFNWLSLVMDDADEARVAATSGAYWIMVPDDCSYTG